MTRLFLRRKLDKRLTIERLKLVVPMMTSLRTSARFLRFVPLAILVGCAQSTSTEETRATPVGVAAADSGPAAPTIRTNGMLVNKDELRLSFKVGGVVSRISVQEGQRVKRGQKLAEIEQAEINAEVERVKQLAEK